MLFKESLQLAFDNLKINKLRSFLTMLGIIIGVSAVIILISMSRGAQEKIISIVEGIGSNLLIVSGGKTKGLVRSSAETTSRLTYDDVLALKKNCPAIHRAVAKLGYTAQVIHRNYKIDTYIAGVTSDFPHVRNFHCRKGRFISNLDVNYARTVCVLGQTVVRQLFPNFNPIGQLVTIQGLERTISFRVIGVMERKGQIFSFDHDDIVFIPLTTLQNKLLNTKYLTEIYLQASSPLAVQKGVTQIFRVLKKRHKKGDFSIRTQEEFLSLLGDVTLVFNLLLGGIASISLLVGGIGIMNIMLVAVSERTREIGIRQAIGARRKDILLQFLIESTILALLGGFIGIILGLVTSKVIVFFSGWPWVFSWASILVAFGFSFFIGVGFGLYPAQKASRLNPIESLRWE